ncbi:hypothetical protein IGI04_007222 [Brassica rapa subsp. trilocularis]|uniref:Uncharacterized protein n=1 Tax=Brassica rapa subsp. trilocularis TaxID=1813537 RepID=A0ABQ7NJ41_BRACM|nr:hypothetical protein IGI04_007222 [Brassica rapa subsp. trilocularis]
MCTPLHLAKRHGEGGVRFLKPSYLANLRNFLNWNSIVVQAVKQSIYFKVYKATVSEVQSLRLELRQATGPCTQIFNIDAGYANQRQIQLSDENRGPAGRGTTEPTQTPPDS